MLDDWLVVTGTMEFFMTFHSVGNSTDEVHDFSGRSTTNQTFRPLFVFLVNSTMFGEIMLNHVLFQCLMMFHGLV